MRKQQEAGRARRALGAVSKSTQGAGTKTFEGIGLRDYGFEL